MPPHCDSIDGPVVTAAANALERNDARLVLPFVPKVAETEVMEAFEAVTAARTLGPEAKQVADRYFFETVVRAEMLRRQARADGDVDATRDYVEAMLGLQVWAHSLHESINGDPHEHAHEHHLAE